MSETDSFIEEVTEEVRRDRLFALMRRYGWIGVVAILGIVGGAAWTEWTKAQERAKAEGFGDAMLASMGAEDPLAAVGTVAAEPGAQEAVRAMMEAGRMQMAGDAAGAVAALAPVANDPSLPKSLSDLAKLKSVLIGAETMDAGARNALLEELAVPGAPYRPLALEQQALAELSAGNTDAALALLKQILAEAGTTPGLQQRASELMVALGADPSA